MNWLSQSLKQEVKKVFQPRYHRKLSDKEIISIADNLTGYIEAILKWRWKKIYANK